MKLNELSPADGSRHSCKRVGRGVGSGHGKTAGRGSKGLKARSGGRVRAGFEGGQMPIHRRLPKRGFKNPFRKQYSIINISDLKGFANGSTVDQVVLSKYGFIKKRSDGIKLLGNGDIQASLIVCVHAVSDNAKKKIEAVGGRVEIL